MRGNAAVAAGRSTNSKMRVWEKESSPACMHRREPTVYVQLGSSGLLIFSRSFYISILSLLLHSYSLAPSIYMYAPKMSIPVRLLLPSAHIPCKLRRSITENCTCLFASPSLVFINALVASFFFFPRAPPRTPLPLFASVIPLRVSFPRHILESTSEEN